MNWTGELNDDDITSLQRDLIIQGGLATAYANRVAAEAANQRDRLIVAATFHRRAGADALLLKDYERAREQFLAAARLYSQLQMPYAVAMAALHSTQAQVLRPYLAAVAASQTLLAPDEVPQLAFAALAQAALLGQAEPVAALQPEQLLARLDRYRAQPIGSVGIPVGVLLDLAAVLDGRDEGDRAAAVRQSIRVIVETYQSAERQAQANAYHYQRLALPYHPAEPDIFSVLRLAEIPLRRQDQTLNAYLAELALEPALRERIGMILDALRRLDVAQ